MPTTPLLAMALGVSQYSAAILHQSAECIAPGEYPVVDAAIESGAEIRSVKVYFRSDKYPKFYYIEMKPHGSGFQSVLPRPSRETEQIVYYIEAVDVTFNSTMGAENVLPVQSDCAREDSKDDAVGPPSAITVGAVEAGSPAIPPGFEAAGIIGTIASTGVMTGLGGGPGIGTAIAVGGIAAAGTGGVVAAASGGGQEEPPGPDQSSGTTSSAPSTPRPPATTTTIRAPTTTTAATTTTAPSTTTVPTATTTTAGTTTTVPNTTTISASSVSACFSASFPGSSCNMKLDAACSEGPIVAWEWVIDPGAAFGGVTTASGATVNRNFPQCSGETVVVTLIVKDSGNTIDTATQAVKLPVTQAQSLRESAAVSCSFTSFLSSERLLASIVIDRARIEHVQSGIPMSHALRAQPGEHEVEAFLTAGREDEAQWIFDFSSCEALSSGSLEPSGGQVVASETRRIAFRLNGTSGERVQFRFRLSR